MGDPGSPRLVQLPAAFLAPWYLQGSRTQRSFMQPPPARSMAARSEIVRQILAEMQSGPAREEHFRRLVDLYYTPVYRVFSKRGFSPDDCLDLTQETFLGIYTGIGSFRGEADFDTWLFKIAMNTFRKRLRWRSADKRKGEEVSIDGAAEDEAMPLPLASPEPAPAEVALRRERSRVIREAMEKLPAQMRKCMALRIEQDLKYREIAVVLRVSIETVKAHLFQGRKRLEEMLGPYFRDSLPEWDEEGS
jgi:RNA polymerase sigma-70 factor, ECF subfamily